MDFSKLLSQTLCTYVSLFLLVIVMKIVGLDYFGIDSNNTTIGIINNFLIKYNLIYIVQFLILWFQLYAYIYITDPKCKINKFKIMILAVINIIIQLILHKFNLLFLYPIINIIILIATCIIFKLNLKRFLIVLFINSIIQILLSFIKSNIDLDYNVLQNFIYSFDYIIILLIWYKLKIEGVDVKCLLHGYFGALFRSLRNFPKRLLVNFNNFKLKYKNYTKQELIAFWIFLPLVVLYNIFTLLIILLIASLNNTVVECIFIISSFWINKRAFGKAFHLNNALYCFVFSSLTYYILNRITTPIGISILVPITLGILLTYITSKFVKSFDYKLFKGMSLEKFDKIILKVIDKNDLYYDVCKMYYIDRLSEQYIAIKLNYSKESIAKFKKKVKLKLKELEK